MNAASTQFRTFRAKISECRTLRSSSVDGESRTLCGREYVVISVVALVEGVRHGGGSEAPELVLSDSFGRHVETWNGRPVVVDHPTDDAGNGVLASTPTILEKSYLGVMMNSKLSDGKLITEAWLDSKAISKSTSEQVKNMWKRLSNGETVEVSVGAIVYTKNNVKGKYRGKEYRGRWEIVIPDHLAFLSGDQIGACSVEDGCGTFRTQQRALSSGVGMAVGALKHGTTMLNDESAEGETTEEQVKSCGCGSEEHEPCKCQNKPSETNLRQYAEAKMRTYFNGKTFSMDRVALMHRALRKRFKGEYVYPYGYNDDTIIFMKYTEGDGYKDYTISYESGEDDSVKLGAEDPVEVIIQAKVVKVPEIGTKERTMAVKKKLSAADSSARDDALNLLDDEEEEEEQSEPVTTQLSARDKDRIRKLHFGNIERMDQLVRLLNGTPIGKELNRQLATAKAATDKVVTFIRGTAQGKFFSEEQLRGMEFDALDTMARALSSATPAEGEAGGSTDQETDNQQQPNGKPELSMTFLQYGGDKKKPAQQQQPQQSRNFAGRAGSSGRTTQDNFAPVPPNVFGEPASKN